jgi:hypothetical protein
MMTSVRLSILGFKLYLTSKVPKNVAFAIVLTSFEQDSVLPTGHKPQAVDLFSNHGPK